MATTPQKDAIVFILDVNPSLWETKYENSAITLLDKGIHAITQMIHQKIIDARKTDQIALVLFNTDETDNKLASQSPGEYSNITIVQDFESPNLGTIKYLRDKLVLGREAAKADIMDALIVGADLLMTMTSGKKTFEKKIFLFTDASSSTSKIINTNGLEQIISQLNDHEINLNILLLKCDNNNNLKSSNNEEILNEFCERVSNGSIYLIDEALEILQQFMTKRVRQVATFRGSLTISPDELEIPINLFTKTSIQRLPPAKKYSPYGSEGVERDLKYLELSNASTTTTTTSSSSSTSTSASSISKNDLSKAYRYGRSLVPFHKIDEAQMQFKTKKSFQVLGFIPAGKIDRESFMSGVYAIVAEPGNSIAQQAISALARALYEKDFVALVRYVRAENNSPKIGILQPRIKTTYESLLFNVLPYSEDYRRYIFKSFPSLVTITPEQDEAMRNWIKGMNLMEAARDENGETMEAMRPGDTFNITFQAHYNAIQNRALRPDDPLITPDPSLLRHLSTPESLLESCSEAFERIKQLFPLKSKKSSQIIENVPRLWAAVAKPFVEEEDNDPLKTTKKRKINPIDPIPDFRSMISEKHEDLVETALMQLMELIPKYVEGGKIDLAFECFKELREASLREDEFELFNTFLIEYKRQAALHSSALWIRLQQVNLTLISSTENAESPIGPIEAQQFISTDLS